MGLFDRDYMRPGYRNEIFSTRPVWVLIFINVIIEIMGAPVNWGLFSMPQYFRPYQLLTAGFVHADFGHIFFNMYGLYLFGSIVARRMPEVRFYLLYFAGVLAGNVLYLAVNFGRMGCLVGASGAVCAMMMAAAMLEPERRFVMIFAPMSPMKMSTLVICYAALEMFLEIFSARGSIAHLAHLGGFLGGYLYLKILFGGALAWDPFRRDPGKTVNFSGFKEPPPPPRGGGNTRVSPAELDALLDKISRDGINSLTPEEYNRLRQAREEMRGEK